ncbi:MAG TPA: hypothetical protein DD738_00890 [Ruminiclostridium sp.]|nr:hypothetical protein [Ruminiclostridium sp.]
MEQRGRAAVLRCCPKGKPKKQKQVYRHLFGRGFDVQALPILQMYRVRFRISKKGDATMAKKRMPMGFYSVHRLKATEDFSKPLMIVDPKGVLIRLTNKTAQCYSKNKKG